MGDGGSGCWGDGGSGIGKGTVDNLPRVHIDDGTMAGQINGWTTSCLRIDIPVDEAGKGCVNGQEVADTLRKLADQFEAGKRPMQHNEDSVRFANVDWL